MQGPMKKSHLTHAALIALAASLLSVPAYAQTRSQTETATDMAAESALPVSQGGTLQSEAGRIVDRLDQTRFITLNIENDMLGGGTDQNYTSGVRVTYHKLGADLPAFAYALDGIIPTFTINKSTSVYYSLGQNLYTPEDIERRTQDPNDRPWAGYLYASAGLSSITNNHIDDIEASVGVVGPWALGEPSQRIIHKIIDSPKPLGWDNQLENEPALMLSWDRRWPERYSFETMGLTATAEPNLGITLGNVYTYANGGMSFRLSPVSGRYQDAPIKVRPAMPGTGSFIVPSGVFSWYLFGGIEGRAVARNIFLDGNTFEDSYSVDKKHFVADATAGLALTYGKVRVSYAAVYRTEEFDQQDGGSIFGTVSLGYRF